MAIYTTDILIKLRIMCAQYLGRTEADFFVTSNSVSVDMFQQSINSARQMAEMEHDFEAARVVATLPITAAGANLSDATIVEGTATAGLKSIVAVRRAGVNGFFYPLDFTRSDIALERDRSELELLDYYGSDMRYPSDRSIVNYLGTGNQSIIQRGGKLFVYPAFSTIDPASVTLYIEGYGWFPDYPSIEIGSTAPASGTPDFILLYGQDYLQWSVISDLNMIFQRFVPRQEGNLPPPDKMRDDALQKLILQDNYTVNTALTRSA